MAMQKIPNTVRTGMVMVGTSKNNLKSLPDPSAITYSVQALESENSGRDVSNGFMDVEVIASKEKIQLTFPPMNSNDVKDVLQAVKSVKFYCRYFSAEEGSFVTKQMYCGDRTAPVLVQLPNKDYSFSSMTVNFIER